MLAKTAKTRIIFSFFQSICKGWVNFLQTQQDILRLAVFQLKMISSSQINIRMPVYLSLATRIEMYVSWLKSQIRKISREQLLVGSVTLMKSLETKINRGAQTKHCTTNQNSWSSVATNKFCDSEQVTYVLWASVSTCVKENSLNWLLLYVLKCTECLQFSSYCDRYWDFYWRTASWSRHPGMLK